MTLALVVLTCVGIQSVANWVAAPHPSAISVQALDTATAAPSAEQLIGFPVGFPSGFPIGIAVVALLLVVGVRAVLRTRPVGSKVLYWDEMPW